MLGYTQNRDYGCHDWGCFGMDTEVKEMYRRLQREVGETLRLLRWSHLYPPPYVDGYIGRYTARATAVALSALLSHVRNPDWWLLRVIAYGKPEHIAEDAARLATIFGYYNSYLRRWYSSRGRAIPKA